MNDNCAFSSPFLIRKPLRRIHNLIYLVFQLSELFLDALDLAIEAASLLLWQPAGGAKAPNEKPEIM